MKLPILICCLFTLSVFPYIFIFGKNVPLTLAEQKLLRMRYYENMTFEEIAQEFDLSVERVRQIEAKTFRKLRQPKRLGDISEDLLGGLS